MVPLRPLPGSSGELGGRGVVVRVSPRELVNAFGGTLERFAGDGLMVFFNDPVPLSEHELQAAKLAIAMRDRIGELASVGASAAMSWGLARASRSGTQR